MESFWVLYWLVIVLSFILGIIVTIKTKKISGVIQSILSVILPIWSIVFSLKRNWVDGKDGEIEFFFYSLANYSLEAIVLLLIYIILIILFIYNIVKLFKKG